MRLLIESGCSKRLTLKKTFGLEIRRYILLVSRALPRENLLVLQPDNTRTYLSESYGKFICKIVVYGSRRLNT